MPNLKLGQKVTVKAHVTREPEKFNLMSYHAVRWGKVVKRHEKPEGGVFVGKRIIKEGWTDGDGVFNETKAVPVYLVATNLATMRRVLPEDVEEATA